MSQVLQERIDQFIDFAKELQLKELSREDTEEEEIRNNIEGAAENEDQDITNDSFVVETRSLSSTLDELIAFDVDTQEYNSGDVEKGKQDYNSADGKEFATRRHRPSKYEGVKYACNQCEYQATKHSHLKRHQESIHEGVRYSCNQCEDEATSQ